MNRIFGLGSLVSLLAAMSSSGSIAADEQAACDSDDRASYICGLRNAEDLVHIPDSSWVLAGQLGPPPTDGGIYFVGVKDGAVRRAEPDFSRPSVAPYAACPGAPPADVFSAHGLGIRHGTQRVHEVLAVNHNGRESIEVFALDMSQQTPRLTWKGCVVVPPALLPNSVAPLPGGGFVATSFGIRTDPNTFEKAMAGEVSGFVAEWSPTAGWSEVPGTLLAANNGVAVSKDGKQLFVTTWGDGKLHILSRGEIPHTRRTIDLAGLRPDNIRVLDDGKLLIAGQAAEASDVFACARQPVCTVGFKVMQFDPASARIEPLLDEPGSARFGGASAAIVVGDEIWVGTFRGDRVARYKLRR
jgi:sugar lactone lactonase YvrE